MTEPSLRCRDLRKKYPGEAGWAVGGPDRGVALELAAGELFALVGPSGCGKTTTLRLVGGFLQPTTGTIEIAGSDVTSLPPEARPTNTVFQQYALFPHMSVRANVGFGLEMERVPKKERHARVARTLNMVGLEEMQDRRISELSGGQAQRAALARAIIKEPQLLLLDEPLGALDLRLRREMQHELVRLKEASNSAFLHVTHDQEEACTIADRIGIMHKGQIVQIDSPVDLYQRPRSVYVAEFIDAGTVMHGRLASKTADVVELVDGALRVRGPARKDLNGSRELAAVLPPATVRVAPAARDHSRDEGATTSLQGTVTSLSFDGAFFEIRVATDHGLELRSAIPSRQWQQMPDRVQTGDRVSAWWRHDDVIFVEAGEASQPQSSGT